MTDDRADPVKIRRAQFGRFAVAGKRAGYGLFGLAIAVFVLGATTGFTPAIVTAVVISLAAGSAVLAPSIIIGYGVKAADRDDRRSARDSR